MKPAQIKVGMRVGLIGFASNGEDVEGKKGAFREGGNNGAIVDMDDGTEIIVHLSQCRILKPKKNEYPHLWINFYSSDFYGLYESKEEADRASRPYQRIHGRAILYGAIKVKETK